MDASVEQIREQEQKPKLKSASLWKRIKNVLLLSSFLGLISANIATLVSDSLHTAAFNTLKSFLGYALTDTALTRVLGQSPTVKRNDDVAVKTKELVDKNTRLTRNNSELEEKHAKLKMESDKKIKTVQKVSKRIATRSVASATRNIVSLPGRAIPISGASIIVGVAVWDIHDLCQNMKDINQLNSAFGHALEDQDQICGMKVPTKEQVLADVKENWQEAYDNAKVQIELSHMNAKDLINQKYGDAKEQAAQMGDDLEDQLVDTYTDAMNKINQIKTQTQVPPPAEMWKTVKDKIYDLSEKLAH
ncbi:hypothetical protein R2083_05265 [Nitrosomonas sp. Is35]|uniref:hypothetical protein n=1 Tax=unclassified Nitrosomonas TaxID=2609265 RepID=UPI00294B137D|nr:MULTISPECIES: hypothetical protein [unclassified Nitrosomonas]MDV6341823.1 hypothetical protein [Nitrosomonas sp. Is24]MDV6346924.1 hypothetical protein [Nitrosomonas sp. Is35]